MNPSYNDEFAPNPFRSASQQQPQAQTQPQGDPFVQVPMSQPQQQPTQQQQGFYNPSTTQPGTNAMMTNSKFSSQPDPYSGMTGALDMPDTPPRVSPTQQAMAHDPSQWSGAMDQRAAAVESYGSGATNPGSGAEIRSSPFSNFGWGTCISCFKMESYSQYFDVETSDVVERLKASLLKFWLPDQFRTSVVGDCKTDTFKGPDLYGPVWISLTLVFLLAVTSNIHAYFKHKRRAKHEDDLEEFEYDIHLLLHSSSVALVFVFCVSTCFWFATNCMGMPGISWAMWVCCYGYSQVPYMLASILIAILPFGLVAWVALGAATGASALLVLRNLSTPLMAQDSVNNAKAGPIIIAILGAHTIYFFVMKVMFFP